MTNEEMTERLVEVEQRSKSNTHRLDAVEKNQEALNSIATSVAVMAEQQKNISDKVDTIDAKVDTLEGKPGKRWEELTREVREHNHFAKRVPVLEEQMKVANHRIQDLEEAVK